MLKSLGTVATFFLRNEDSNLAPATCKANAQILLGDMVSAIYLTTQSGERYQMVACDCSEMTEAETLDRLAWYFTPECVAHHLTQWTGGQIEFVISWRSVQNMATSLRAEADEIERWRLARTA